MTRRLIISPRALADLIDTREYPDRTAGSLVASRVLTGLLDGMDGLAAGTVVGHPRPDSAAVNISRVLHSARDIRAISL